MKLRAPIIAIPFCSLNVSRSITTVPLVGVTCHMLSYRYLTPGLVEGSGAFDSASALIKDLLPFRADRGRYYYAAGAFFKRHFSVRQMSENDAPALTPELLDGLTWRSRIAMNGNRRTYYCTRYVTVDLKGKFAKTLVCGGMVMNPICVCHKAWSRPWHSR